MYRKKVSHPIYGTFYVEEEDFLDFHRTLAGLSQLEDAAEEFASHGVEVEDMEPGFIKVRDDGKEIVYWKILDATSEKQMTLGVTHDEDRFPFYPREDGYWEPEGQGARPDGSKTSRRAPARGESDPSENGQSTETTSTTTTHEKLAMPPGRSDEAKQIQQIKNAQQEWATNILDDEHQKAIWRHVQRIRADDPEEALQEALSEIGAEDMTITYAGAAKVLKMVENPALMEGEGAPELDPDDELPF